MTKQEDSIIISLVDRVSRVEEKVGNLVVTVNENSQEIKANTTVIANLITSLTREEGQKKGIKNERNRIEKKQLTNWQKTAIIISAILGITIVSSSWILHFIK